MRSLPVIMSLNQLERCRMFDISLNSLSLANEWGIVTYKNRKESSRPSRAFKDRWLSVWKCLIAEAIFSYRIMRIPRGLRILIFNNRPIIDDRCCTYHKRIGLSNKCFVISVSVTCYLLNESVRSLLGLVHGFIMPCEFYCLPI